MCFVYTVCTYSIVEMYSMFIQTHVFLHSICQNTSINMFCVSVCCIISTAKHKLKINTNIFEYESTIYVCLWLSLYTCTLVVILITTGE